jgi:16S rRNA (adenine1518-N6/adenine1519-N6)-dimethyltransferase
MSRCPMAETDLGPPPPFNLCDPRVVQATARRFGIEARKSFSQHWLVDRDALDAILAAAELGHTDNVLEFGAGMGVLTAELARRAGRVTAVEIERDVLPALQAMTAPYPTVTIINDDLLRVNPSTVFGGAPYKVVANLPYAITAKALRHVLEAAHPPERVVVLIQREVALRIMAKPGDMSLLALSVQFFAAPRIVARVPAASFMPPPEVDSAIIALDRRPPLTDAATRDRLFNLAKLAFSQRRKQLHNILPGMMHLPQEEVLAWLASCQIAPDRRPQTLTMEEWIRLAESDPRPRKTTGE